MGLLVKPVETWWERRQFLGLPWKLHAANPHWVPPLRRTQKEMVGYAKHPFHEQAEVQTFIAKRDGKPVGRIAAIMNHVAIAHSGENRGNWGFFESIDDAEVAHALFDAVKQWLIGKGVKSARGPVNPSMNYECGLLIDGFDIQPTFMMPYNPPYYQRLVESYGHKKTQDLFTFVGKRSMLAGVDPKIERVGRMAIERFNLVIRPIDKKRFAAEIPLYLDIYNRSMAGMWGFTPLTASEIKRMAGELRMLILPELALIGEIDGQAVGAVFGLPDYNPRIKKINGRLFPFGFLTLLSRKPFLRFRAISTTVVPEYQMWGLAIPLLVGLMPAAEKYGLDEVEFSWVAESNQLSRGSLERGGALLEKTHRLYDLELLPQ